MNESPNIVLNPIFISVLFPLFFQKFFSFNDSKMLLNIPLKQKFNEVNFQKFQKA